MMNYQPTMNSTDRYDDGVAVDYAFMIRMWSAFDRSLSAFERKCGLPAVDKARANAGTNQTKDAEN
jgi:hypothetical protein